jgi:hypothetical protein
MGDVKQLRTLAKAATPGPWRYPVGGAIAAGKGDIFAGAVRTDDAAYIAAASPDRILALLDRIDDCERILGYHHGASNEAEEWATLRRERNTAPATLDAANRDRQAAEERHQADCDEHERTLEIEQARSAENYAAFNEAQSARQAAEEEALRRIEALPRQSIPDDGNIGRHQAGRWRTNSGHVQVIGYDAARAVLRGSTETP